MHFLIDADTAMYKAGCSDETRWYDVIDIEGDVVRPFQYKKEAQAYADESPYPLFLVPRKTAGPLKNALSNLKTYMNKIIDHPECTTYEVFIGGTGNFRYDVDPTYKQDRDPMGKPLHLSAMKDYMVKKYGAHRCDGMEADDVVSIHIGYDLKNNCIVSVDKDLRNTPGWHFNPDKLTLDYITESEADLNFYRQLLMGDSTDGIVGIAGYGKAASTRILPVAMPPEDMCAVVWEHYKLKGYDMDYFVQQGRLLWMLREEGIMWTPSLENEDA